MKKKKIISLLMVVLIAASLTLSGCGSKDKEVLNLFIWTEYIPQSVLDDFEDETGIEVRIQTFSNNEEMLAKVNGSNKGTYDIVCPSDYMVENMISKDMLLKLDKTKFKNYKNINEAYLNQSFDPESDYSVPYLGGVGLIVYNKEMVRKGADFTNYEELYNPFYKNSIVMLDDFRSIIGVSSLSLGYDFNETDTAKLEKVKDKMKTLKTNIKSLDSDSPKTMMVTEETSVGLIWSGEVAIAMEENDKLAIEFPDKGMYMFLDNLCITKDAKNSANAYKFIDYVLRAKVNKAISEEFPYLNPNKAGVALMDDAYRNNKAICIPDEEIKKAHYVENIGKTVDVYSEMWAEFTK
jgi:spermidine/putrescine transport system substrate-binding protein/spermidine/putrescine transport system permease protein